MFSGIIVVFIHTTHNYYSMIKSESMKKPSSLQVSETIIIYIIAAVVLAGVMIVAFAGWQG